MATALNTAFMFIKRRSSVLTQGLQFLERSHSCIKTSNRQISVKVPQGVIQESLSDNNKQRVSKHLETLAKSKPIKLSCPEEAAVLVPFCIVDNKPSLLFTLRSTSLVSHRGQVSFPGGKRDKEDKTLVDTAIRETVEEIGMKENIIDVWGSMPPMPDRKGKVAVTSVVSCLGEIDVDKIPFNHDEVSEVFHLTLEHLLEHRRYTKFTNGVTMPVFVNGPHTVWGMTATMVDFLFEIIFPVHYNKAFGLLNKVKLPWLSKANRKSINDKILNKKR